MPLKILFNEIQMESGNPLGVGKATFTINPLVRGVFILDCEQIPITDVIRFEFYSYKGLMYTDAEDAGFIWAEHPDYSNCRVLNVRGIKEF